MSCEFCGAAFPPVPKEGGAAGYAVMRDGSKICYACADAQQREDLKDRSRPFVAYISSNGKAITTWTGGHLMTITQSWPVNAFGNGRWYGTRLWAIRATDIHGGRWYGRGQGAGMAIRLRAVKQSPKERPAEARSGNLSITPTPAAPALSTTGAGNENGLGA